ncbi:MAG: hypothetical protein LLG45_07265 [Actinomycetia bacterium]|nr:hypothetical protein [Actinomycetes bacterium]
MSDEQAPKAVGSGVERYFVPRPAYEVVPALKVVGRIPAMTLMSNDLVPGSNMYVETGWVLAMPDPNPHIFEHVHDYDEIVIHLGTDPDDPEDLGGEIEFVLDGRPFTIDKSSSVFVPKGVKHGPLTWRRFTRPHLELTIMIGAGSLAEADPGGHQEKMEGKEGRDD